MSSSYLKYLKSNSFCCDKKYLRVVLLRNRPRFEIRFVYLRARCGTAGPRCAFEVKCWIRWAHQPLIHKFHSCPFNLPERACQPSVDRDGSRARRRRRSPRKKPRHPRKDVSREACRLWHISPRVCPPSRSLALGGPSMESVDMERPLGMD